MMYKVHLTDIGVAGCLLSPDTTIATLHNPELYHTGHPKRMAEACLYWSNTAVVVEMYAPRLHKILQSQLRVKAHLVESETVVQLLSSSGVKHEQVYTYA